MLGGIKDAGGAEWSVLIMDAVTTRVMSRACRISEILDYGVSCMFLHSACMLVSVVACSASGAWAAGWALTCQTSVSELPVIAAVGMRTSCCLLRREYWQLQNAN